MLFLGGASLSSKVIDTWNFILSVADKGAGAGAGDLSPFGLLAVGLGLGLARGEEEVLFSGGAGLFKSSRSRGDLSETLNRVDED